MISPGWTAMGRHMLTTWAALCILRVSSKPTQIFSTAVSLATHIQSATGKFPRSPLLLYQSVDNISSSKLSAEYAHEARAEVLRFFNASKDYTVIFTANTSAALKLVGESFPFAAGSSYVLGTDSHNSVSFCLPTITV